MLHFAELEPRSSAIGCMHSGWLAAWGEGGREGERDTELEREGEGERQRQRERERERQRKIETGRRRGQKPRGLHFSDVYPTCFRPQPKAGTLLPRFYALIFAPQPHNAPLKPADHKAPNRIRSLLGPIVFGIQAYCNCRVPLKKKESEGQANLQHYWL